jgi:hypothetical protein
MASQNEVKTLLAKAAIDPKFSKNLLADPGGAARREGITLTGAQIDAINSAKASIRAGNAAIAAKLANAAKVIVAWL